jgi:hypothetical protein
VPEHIVARALVLDLDKIPIFDFVGLFYGASRSRLIANGRP